MREKTYSADVAIKKYSLLTDEMLYNILINLRDNGLTIKDLSEQLGITTEELLNSITDEKKDFLVCYESLNVLKKQKNFKNNSRLQAYEEAKKK